VTRGAVVVVESPSWPGCLDVFRAAGAVLVGVPVDDQSISLDGMARALADRQPALLYVMPTFHNPTGMLMSASRRRLLADLGSPVLDQEIAARLIPRLGELTATRATSRRRRLERLAGLLDEHLPDWRWALPAGGSSLWVGLPDTDAAVFAQVALCNGVEVVPGAPMDRQRYPRQLHPPAVRLPRRRARRARRSPAARLDRTPPSRASAGRRPPGRARAMHRERTDPPDDLDPEGIHARGNAQLQLRDHLIRSADSISR